MPSAGSSINEVHTKLCTTTSSSILDSKRNGVLLTSVCVTRGCPVLKNIIVLFGPIVKFGGVIEQGRQNGSSIGVRFGGSRPTDGHSAAASAPPTPFKTATISRAKRSAAMPGWAGHHAGITYR